MHAASMASTWCALVAGVAVGTIGGLTLTRRRALLPSQRDWDWRRLGRSQMLLGVFVLLETVPRVAHASADLGLVLSVVAFLPLVAGLALGSKARPKSTTYRST